MTENDQPRPDLDAAVDAVLPSLTAVSADAVAASLRRTRVALADAAPARGSLGSWRWAVPAAALVAAAIAAAEWWPSSPIEAPRVVSSDVPRLAPPTPKAAPAPAPAQTRRVTPPRVSATSVRTAELEAPRPDPLVALVRAVQAIPEEAWNESLAQANAPMGAAELSVAPIVVAPLVTPPITEPPALPVQGEP